MAFQKLSSIVKGFASRVLAIDDTALPKSHLTAIREMLCSNGFEFNGKNLGEILVGLRQKHVVESIIVTKRDGSVIATTEENGLKEAITGTALFNYVSSELMTPETVLIKSNGEWFMVFPFSEKIFVVKASASLSTIELKAIAKELDSFLKLPAYQSKNKAF